MRLTLTSLGLFALGSASSLAGPAFSALQLLPPELRQRVAVIAGRDGTPEPERWHILVHDPATEAGVREFVVTAGRMTADRTLSQFAESLTAGDIISPDALKIDSEHVGRVALQFGAANGVTVSALHFELRKSGPEAAPLWTVTCLDMAGAELGKIVVSSTRGTVIMHPGFAKEPALDTVLAAARQTPPPVAEGDAPTPAR
ncbi:MAG: hypothetical protein ABMA13_14015, partial [Chthoniobacteraceae bacterium]